MNKMLKILLNYKTQRAARVAQFVKCGRVASSSLAAGGVPVLCPWARHFIHHLAGSSQHNLKIVDCDVKNEIVQTIINPIYWDRLTRFEGLV